MLTETSKPLARDCSLVVVAHQPFEENQLLRSAQEVAGKDADVYALVAPTDKRIVACVCARSSLRDQTIHSLIAAGWGETWRRFGEILLSLSEAEDGYDFQALKQLIEHLKQSGRTNKSLLMEGLVWATEKESDESLCRSLDFYPIYCLAPIGDFADLASAERPVIVWARPLQLSESLKTDLAELSANFLHRWASLSSSAYIRLPSRYLTGVASYAMTKIGDANERVTDESIHGLLDTSDLDRLSRYISPGMDASLVGDLWLPLALLFFRGHCGGQKASPNAQRVDPLELTPFQKIALMGVGLQGRTIDAIAGECDVPKDQMNIQFTIALRRYRDFLMAVKAAKVAKQVDQDIAETTRNMIADRMTIAEEASKPSRRNARPVN